MVLEKPPKRWIEEHHPRLGYDTRTTVPRTKCPRCLPKKPFYIIGKYR